MDSAALIAVARVVKAHGLKGEVSVTPVADLPFVLREGMLVWVIPPAQHVSGARIESIRSGPKGPLVKIEGIDDIDAAQAVQGRELRVSEEDVPRDLLDDVLDFVGFEVTLEDGRSLGTVAEIIVTGANDVWVVRGSTFGEVLIPVIDDVLIEVDEAGATALVRLLPGLIDGEM